MDMAIVLRRSHLGLATIIGIALVNATLYAFCIHNVSLAVLLPASIALVITAICTIPYYMKYSAAENGRCGCGNMRITNAQQLKTLLSCYFLVAASFGYGVYQILTVYLPIWASWTN